MPDAGIVAYHNFDIERSLARLPAYAVARFTRSVLLSRTARNCAFLPDTERTFYLRAADFFGGADFLRGAPFGELRASLTPLPAWNRTALLAAILMVSPVRGFRPARAGRAATLKLPRPETRTASPASRPSRMASTTALTARPAAAWFS